MKALKICLVVVLALLAISSGAAKILLMPQEVEFFSAYGFSKPMLAGFGALQVLAGIGLIIVRTRVVGATVVAVTFLISAALLYQSENIPVLIMTLIATLLLVPVIKPGIKTARK